MKYAPAEDDLVNGLFYRRVSEDGRWEIAVHPVIFGFRIIVGEVGSGSMELNYCAGDQDKWIELIYATVLTALENDVPLRSFPFQDVKPMINDPECWAKIMALLGDKPVTLIQLPLVHIKKARWISGIFNP